MLFCQGQRVEIFYLHKYEKHLLDSNDEKIVISTMHCKCNYYIFFINVIIAHFISKCLFPYIGFKGDSAIIN